MYTFVLLTCGQVGCNGGGYYQSAPQFYYPPPAVFNYSQFPQFPIYPNYNGYSFQQQQFSGGYSFGNYSFPQQPTGYSSPAWGQRSWGVQRGLNLQIGGGRLLQLEMYGQRRFCPTCP